MALHCDSSAKPGADTRDVEHPPMLPAATGAGHLKTSPFDRVPSEIVRLILTSTFLSYRDHNPIPKFRFPSISCRVSRLFYDATIFTPVLWSYIYLSPETAKDLTHVDDRINCRSGVLPLDIFLAIGTGEPSQDLLIIDRVASCLPRWRRASIHLCDQLTNNAEVVKQLTNLLQSPGPRPTYLNMFSDMPIGGIWSVDLLRPSSSQLRQLRLHNCCVSLGGLVLPSTVEDLSITGDSVVWVKPGEIVRFLLGGSSLRSLSLAGVYIDLWDLVLVEGEVSLPPPCTLKNLEAIELGPFTLREATIILGLIDAPRMQYLSLYAVLSGSGDEGPWDESILRLWKDFRFRALREVTLRNMIISNSSLRFLFANLPDSMERLTIHYDEGRQKLHFVACLRHIPVEHNFSRIRHLRVSGVEPQELIGVVDQHFKYLESLEVDAKDLGPVGDYGPEIDAHPSLVRLSGLVGKLRVIQNLVKPVRRDFCSLVDLYEGAWFEI